ncbi:MAG: hypothetical protein R2932_55510, partial [Caldilineaceae bacterium]
LSPVQWLGAAALVPVIRLVGDAAKMVGYPVGLWWRWRRRTDSVIYWRKQETRDTRHMTRDTTRDGSGH